MNKKNILIQFFILFVPSILFADVYIEADGPGNTYSLIQSKSHDVQVPDCCHPVEHISEIWDNDLNKYVFLLSIHRDLDNDRCINFDRQRNEIYTTSSSIYALNNNTLIYTWKFKLDSLFQPSTGFCHIHQLKPSGGSDDSMPAITLTPLKGSPDKLQLLHCAGGSNQSLIEKTYAALSLFKGVWVEVYERSLSSDNGTYEIVIRRISDGAILLFWRSSNLDLWRTGAESNRSKYGIYRSLSDIANLRDEEVRYADFYASKSLLLKPQNVTATAGNGQIRLSAANNNSQMGFAGFNVYRSLTSGSGYSKINTSLLGTADYTDNNVINGTTYYYVMTSVDTSSNESSYSKEVSATVNAGNAVVYTYNFSDVSQANTNNKAYACDVDVFPFSGIADNMNSKVEATDDQYVSISANDRSQWTPLNPGSGDQTLLWAEMHINQSPEKINRIDLNFSGNTEGAILIPYTAYRIYVLKAGADWTQNASWVKLGADDFTVLPNVDTRISRSITSNIGDYIDGSGKIVWVVYETILNQLSHINYVEMTVTAKTCQDIQTGGYGLSSDLNKDCYVDLKDLNTIGTYWLNTDCATIDCEGADFTPSDGIVNFTDFTDFSNGWTQCNNPSDSNCIKN